MDNEFLGEKVLLTNGRLCDKMEVHIKGLQHYAFSIFLFDPMGNMLLQKRAKEKYHSGGLWSNTCCSHPLLISSIKDVEKQASSRLFYEMGIRDVSLKFMFLFAYNEKISNFRENEIDYIFTCVSNKTPLVNKEEIEDYKWVRFVDLEDYMRRFPEKFTIWFRKIIELHGKQLIRML